VSAPEDLLALHLRAYGIEHEREYRFAAEEVGRGVGLRDRLAAAGLKDWRADIAMPEHRLLVEIEGGAWSGGRHTRGKGFADDLRKYDAAARLGWTIYRCDPAMVQAGHAIETVLILLRLKRIKSGQSAATV
jgi:very-short-patch-repair endonuclease